VPHSCIDGDAQVKMTNGHIKNIKSLEIGDRVKTLDDSGKLIDTNVIMIMDTSNQTSILLSFITMKKHISS